MVSDSLRPFRRYTRTHTVDADDLRQELEVAALTGADPVQHLWNLVRREVRLRNRNRDIDAGRDVGSLDDDRAAAMDLIDRLGLVPADRAAAEECYATGRYPKRLVARLRRAGDRLDREDYL